MHDPCVIAYLLKPKLFKGRKVNVQIETKSELTLGMSVADYWGVTNEKTHKRNVYFIRDVNAKGFYKLLTKRLALLP